MIGCGFLILVSACLAELNFLNSPTYQTKIANSEGFIVSWGHLSTPTTGKQMNQVQLLYSLSLVLQSSDLESAK